MRTDGTLFTKFKNGYFSFSSVGTLHADLVVPTHLRPDYTLSVMSVKVGMANCGLHSFGRIVGVTYSRYKLALRARLRNLNLKSQFSIFDSFRGISVHNYEFLKILGGFWAWQTCF